MKRSREETEADTANSFANIYQPPNKTLVTNYATANANLVDKESIPKSIFSSSTSVTSNSLAVIPKNETTMATMATTATIAPKAIASSSAAMISAGGATPTSTNNNNAKMKVKATTAIEGSSKLLGSSFVGETGFDVKKRTTFSSMEAIASAPGRSYLLYETVLKLVRQVMQTYVGMTNVSSIRPPPWFTAVILPDLQYRDINNDLYYSLRTMEPFTYLWRLILEVAIDPTYYFPNVQPSLPRTDDGIIFREDLLSDGKPDTTDKYVKYPSSFPADDKTVYDNAYELFNKTPIEKLLTEGQIYSITYYITNLRYDPLAPEQNESQKYDEIAFPLIVKKKPTSWSELMIKPTAHSLTYLAIMHAVHRAIDGGLVKDAVLPIPNWMEIMCVPERRTFSWEAEMQDKILKEGFITSADSYKTLRGWGPRSTYWASILSTANNATRWIIGDSVPSGRQGQGRDVNIQSKTAKIINYEIAVIKSHGIRFVDPISDPLSFLEDVLMRAKNVDAPSDYAKLGLGSISDNDRVIISWLYDAITKKRTRTSGKWDDINAGVGIANRVWHPKWQAVFPEDSVIVDGYSDKETAIQARSPFFPWDISVEHGGPIELNGEDTDKSHPEPPAEQVCKFRAYDSYFTHPDQQLTFYQNMIAEVESNDKTKMYMPPPTWFDGYFLERLSNGRWDVRQVSNRSCKVGNEPNNVCQFNFKFPEGTTDEQKQLLYVLHEVDHTKGAQFYIDQLKAVEDEENFDGLKDARSQFWFRMYYMHKRKRPNGIMLSYSHPPRVGKTRKFFRSLLRGIKQVEGAVISAAGDLISFTASQVATQVIRSASEVTKTIINEVSDELPEIISPFQKLGKGIFDSLGIKLPKGINPKALQRAFAIVLIVIIVLSVYRIYLKNRPQKTTMINMPSM